MATYSCPRCGIELEKSDAFYKKKSSGMTYISHMGGNPNMPLQAYQMQNDILHCKRCGEEVDIHLSKEEAIKDNYFILLVFGMILYPFLIGFLWLENHYGVKDYFRKGEYLHFAIPEVIFVVLFFISCKEESPEEVPKKLSKRKRAKPSTKKRSKTKV
jgi:DNA-directed RNA polymerase subunit RPC12/RpoP